MVDTSEQGKRYISEDMPDKVPCCVGLGLYWVFVGAMFNSTLGASETLPSGLALNLFVHLWSLAGGALGFVAVLAAFALAGRSGTRAPARPEGGLPALGGLVGTRPGRWLRPGLVASAVLWALFGAGSYVLAGADAGLGAVALCAAAQGVFTVPAQLAWAHWYAKLDQRALMAVSALSFALSTVLVRGIVLLGDSAALAALALCPLGATALLPGMVCVRAPRTACAPLDSTGCPDADSRVGAVPTCKGNDDAMSRAIQHPLGGVGHAGE